MLDLRELKIDNYHLDTTTLLNCSSENAFFEKDDNCDNCINIFRPTNVIGNGEDTNFIIIEIIIGCERDSIHLIKINSESDSNYIENMVKELLEESTTNRN